MVFALLLCTPHVRGQFYRLASRIFHKDLSITPTFLFERCLRSNTRPCVALFMLGMYFWLLGSFFLMKRRSLLDALSSSTLSPLLASSMLLRSLFRCFLGLFRAFFFEFSHLLGLFNNFLGSAFRELLISSPKTLSMVTTAVTLPVSGFLIVISLALIVSGASLVDLFGWVSVDI